MLQFFYTGREGTQEQRDLRVCKNILNLQAISDQQLKTIKKQ
jgi:hypothetical protein